MIQLSVLRLSRDDGIPLLAFVKKITIRIVVEIAALACPINDGFLRLTAEILRTNGIISDIVSFRNVPAAICLLSKR